MASKKYCIKKLWGSRVKERMTQYTLEKKRKYAGRQKLTEGRYFLKPNQTFLLQKYDIFKQQWAIWKNMDWK